MADAEAATLIGWACEECGAGIWGPEHWRELIERATAMHNDGQPCAPVTVSKRSEP